jgi:hypothetical protein
VDGQLPDVGHGVYLRAEPDDMSILNGSDQQRRAKLIKLEEWRSIASS